MDALTLTKMIRARINLMLLLSKLHVTKQVSPNIPFEVNLPFFSVAGFLPGDYSDLDD